MYKLNAQKGRFFISDGVEIVIRSTERFKLEKFKPKELYAAISGVPIPLNSGT